MWRAGGRWRRSRRYSPRSRRARMATRLDLTNAELTPVPQVTTHSTMGTEGKFE